MCHGACPKDAAYTRRRTGVNYLCRGYKRFFNHCRPFIDELAALWQRVSKVEEALPPHAPPHAPPAAPAKLKIGRNDPCPCGSGRKFKKCCLGR